MSIHNKLVILLATLVFSGSVLRISRQSSESRRYRGAPGRCPDGASRSGDTVSIALKPMPRCRPSSR